VEVESRGGSATAIVSLLPVRASLMSAWASAIHELISTDFDSWSE
jgi:hypothetical protein